MITLAMDTSDFRGSVAILRGEEVLAETPHTEESEYSAWLLPAVQRSLEESAVKLDDVELLAVSTGPGSFTGLRVGLTTVKAWAEVYKKPVVGVPRLLAMALRAHKGTPLVAACYDAQRGQLFGAAYEALGTVGNLKRIVEDIVVSPGEFVEMVVSEAGTRAVSWISLDPEMIQGQAAVERRMSNGDRIVKCSPELASSVGIAAQERVARGEFSDPVTLDANYVRRSDAEIFWKGASAGVR